MIKPSIENCGLTKAEKGLHAVVTSEGYADHFFEHQGLVCYEFVLQAQTVHEHFYTEVLTRLVNKIH